MAGALLALAGAGLFVVGTPLLASPQVRAGIVRKYRVRAAQFSWKPKPTARLEVPFLRQEHALSCEVAALRMALAYRGIAVTERELLDAVGVDPAPRRRAPDGTTTWGDPDVAFVGDVDGSTGRTGYGVYAGPIGKVAGQYRKAKTLSNATPQALADAIAQGNPVVVCGFLGRGRLIPWQTLGGRMIPAIEGEHARVAMGYTGTQDEPTGFFLMDPVYGEQYWKLDAFLMNWGALRKMGVVVE